MMKNIGTASIKVLSTNQQKVRSLVHSAFDVAQELHTFSLALIDDSLVTTPAQKEGDQVFD
jgi:hypothetical protein